jgi:hypothetical protein
MVKRTLCGCALALALVVTSLPASAQADRRAAAEATPAWSTTPC